MFNFVAIQNLQISKNPTLLFARMLTEMIIGINIVYSFSVKAIFLIFYSLMGANMRTTIIASLLIIFSSCISVNNNEINEQAVTTNKKTEKSKIFVNGNLLEDFIGNNSPNRVDNEYAYCLFDSKLQIDTGNINCEIMENTEVAFRNGVLESFLLGEPWYFFKGSEPIPSGSKITLHIKGNKVLIVNLKEDTIINGVKVAKGKPIYFYPNQMKEESIAYFVPAEGYMDGNLPISGGEPIYLYENGSVAKCTTSGSRVLNLQPGSEVLLHPNGVVQSKTIYEEVTKTLCTIPGGSIVTYYPNGYIQSLTTKYDIPRTKTGLKGGIKANTKVYFDDTGKIVRYTLNEEVKEESGIGENTEIVKYKGGKPAKVVFKYQDATDTADHCPAYFYENGRPMKATINYQGETEVFFDKTTTPITDEFEIEKIVKITIDIDNMYKSLDWEWDGYNKLYQFHEEKGT